MPKFHIKWHVTEYINGRDFDRNLRHGDSIDIANGEITKEGESEEALRAELTAALEMGFPLHEMAGTYEADRVYHINITEV